MSESEFNPKSLDATLASIMAKQDEIHRDLVNQSSVTAQYRRDLDSRLTAIGERVARVEVDCLKNNEAIKDVESNQKKILLGAGVLATAGSTGGSWLAKLFGH